MLDLHRKLALLLATGLVLTTTFGPFALARGGDDDGGGGGGHSGSGGGGGGDETGGGGGRGSDDIPDTVIVRLQPGTDVQRFNDDYGLRPEDELEDLPVFRLGTTPGADLESLCYDMLQDPRVLSAESDAIARQSETKKQWTSVFDGGKDPVKYVRQKATKLVNFSRAAKVADGHGVTVAILDTGISLHQPLLQEQLLPGWNAIDGSTDTDDSPNGVDDNANGFTDEGTGHGTMVAGLVSLLAPKAKLLPVKVLDSDGAGDLWALARGIRWAVDHDARVINISVAIMRSSDMLNDAADYAEEKGVVIVTSAGNNNTKEPQFPAGISKAVTVASLNADGTKAGFSNWGTKIDVCAPGVKMLSTDWDGGFAVWSGTSFSSPLVAGQAALIRSAWPKLSARNVIRTVERTSRSVDTLNPAYRGKLGDGLIDVDRSVLHPLRGG